MKLTKNAVLALTLSLMSQISVSAQEEITTVSEPQGVNLTVYNQNFAVVKDERNVDLKQGINYLRFEDVAAKIDPTSVSFASLSAPNTVVVREQNYQYDLLDPTTILSKSVGKTVKFKQILPAGQTQEIVGTLLNPPSNFVSDPSGNTYERSQGLVVKTVDGIVLNPRGQVELAELPSGLVAKPSLLWKLESTKPGKHKSQISYQTQGLNWHCDYVAVLNDNDSQLDLTSWVTLDNKSGASYKNAALKLMAGDVHRAQPPKMMFMRGEAAAMDASMAPQPQFQEAAFAEYHLYTLLGKTSVLNNETKQLSLFAGNNINVKKLYTFEGPSDGQPYYGGGYGGDDNAKKVQVKVEFVNSQENHLGVPMPKGKVRVYKKDKDGALEFVGEDMVDHTAANEKVRLYLGNAFDIVAEKKLMNSVQVSNKVIRYTYEIELRNQKDSDVNVTCIEHAYGNWKVISSSEPYVKKDAHTFEFTPKVPAKGKNVLTYVLEIKHP